MVQLFYNLIFGKVPGRLEKIRIFVKRLCDKIQYGLLTFFTSPDPFSNPAQRLRLNPQVASNHILRDPID